MILEEMYEDSLAAKQLLYVTPFLSHVNQIPLRAEDLFEFIKWGGGLVTSEG
jgi:hypothetical protein